MKTINDGGPAFPRTVQAWNGHLTAHDGMTLRDWFAGQALQAIISATCAGQHDPSTKHGKSVEAAMAMDAYLLADAMIAARGDRQ